MTDAVTRRWVRSKADEKAVASGCVFDLRAAERVREFFTKFIRHSKGKFAGKSFELQEWQWLEIVAPLYGWKRPNGMRRYKRSTTFIGKKNGKSTICAGLILYGLVADGERGAEVYGAAADRNQAAIIFNEVKAMVQQSPQLSARLNIKETSRRIEFAQTHSFYQVLSKDSRKTGHGVNASMTVIDELHVVDRELDDTLKYAGAARSQPLSIDISTAGNSKDGVGYERYLMARRLIAGEIEDPETLAVVYEADKGKWEDEGEWHKANPSLGVTITLDSFRSDYQAAKNGSPATQATFQQLRLGIWQDMVDSWLPTEAWDACTDDLDEDALVGMPCWGGLDLASKLDICAWAMVFDTGDDLIALFRFWAPEGADSRRQKANRAQLKEWVPEHLTLTEGDVTDYDAIEKAIKNDCARFGVSEVRFDPWNATQLTTHLMSEGITCVEFGQTIRNFNEPMKELEKRVISGKIRHAGNKVMRWMVGHCKVRKDGNGNVRPDKEHSGDHIDGVSALAMAIAGAITSAEDQTPGVFLL